LLVSILKENTEPIFIKECLKKFNEKASKSKFGHGTNYGLYESAVYLMNLFRESPKEYQVFYFLS